MKRISTPTRSINLFGAGKDGFKNGDLATGVQPTNLDAGWFNQMQEEIAQTIEGAGIGINENYNTQLLQAVRRMSGGYVRMVMAGHTVLTADDAGLVVLDATAGAVTIALPRANVLKALPFTFRRIDSTVNLVTVSVAGIGGDVIDGEATSFELTGNQAKNLVSDGTGVWYSDIVGITQAQGDVRYALLSALGSYLTTASAATMYAPRNNPEFSGLPKVPTATPGTNTTQAASTEFTQSAIAAKSPFTSCAISSKTVNTTYTNSNSGPLFIGLQIRAPGSGVYEIWIDCYVNGVVVASGFAINWNGAWEMAGYVSFFVSSGSTYRIAWRSYAGTIIKMTEAC